ncbi:RNase P subunit p30 family protein [Haloplanus salinarum]|uniref:RNase P subunit p30 family protein n=1 Tax=Haloplanus salinarum TaxID=1912324 RepID=UPI00214B6A31|nr:RNase P subunit p30 family protein [Haloplanus salinarum]
MYEAVHVAPDGDSPATDVVERAARLGFEGVVVLARDATPEHDALRDASGIDVVDGVEVVAPDPERASGAVGGRRPNHTVLAVRGGTDRLNRFAVENERVDVLTRPMADDGDVNHVLANRAAENGVRIEFDLGPVLRSTGGPRVQALRDLRKLRELVVDADAPFVVSAGAPSRLGLRAPRELVAVGETIGFDPDTVRAGLREWGALAGRNRHRRSESFVEPGVERGPYEDDGGSR